MPAPAAGQPPNLFAILAQKFGISAALQILALIDPQAGGAAKGFAGARLAGEGAQIAGGLSGSPTLSGIGRGVGTAAGLAGTGYDISKIAGSDLSAKKKGGHISGDVANLIASYLVPYYGVGVAAKTVADIMRQSGSPEIRGAGQAIAQPALPVEALLSVIGGDKSPRAAGNEFVAQSRNTPVLGKMISPIADLFGLGTKPTTGTGFRSGEEDIFKKLGLPGFDRSKAYLAPTGKFSDASRGAADQLSKLIAQLGPGYGQNPAGYTTQTFNILLNTLGDQLPGMMPGILGKLGKLKPVNPF